MVIAGITLFLTLALAAAVFGYVVLVTWQEGTKSARGSLEYYRFRLYFYLFLAVWAAGVFGAAHLAFRIWDMIFAPGAN